MRRWSLGRVAHPRKGERYCEYNCPRGIMHAADAGYPWIDIDGNPFRALPRIGNSTVTRYVTGGTHWFRPLAREDFRDPLDEIGRTRTTASMLMEEGRRLVAPGGFRIWTMTTLFRIAAEEGINVLEELKYHRAFESVALHRREHHAVLQLQEKHPRFHVIVAILSTHPRAVFVAQAAKRAGRKTCLIAKDDYPASWRPHFDYVRGTGKARPVK